MQQVVYYEVKIYKLTSIVNIQHVFISLISWWNIRATDLMKLFSRNFKNKSANIFEKQNVIKH